MSSLTLRLKEDDRDLDDDEFLGGLIRAKTTLMLGSMRCMMTRHDVG